MLSMDFFVLCFLLALRLEFYTVAGAIPFEIFKSPLEKAKIVLEENIFKEVNKSIDAYQYKYVSFIYSNESKEKVCSATIEDSLAHSFLKNAWDRKEVTETIDPCGLSDITMLDSDDIEVPNFTFDIKPLSCKHVGLSSPNTYWYTQKSIFYRDTKYHLYTSMFLTNKSLDFTKQTQIDIPYTKIIQIAEKIDFDTIYKQYIDDYWKKNIINYSKYLRLSFVQSIIYQLKEGSLSEKAASLALHAAYGSGNLEIYFLGLLKYTFFNLSKIVYATNIVCIINTTDRHMLLYVGGNSSPIHEFSNMTEMKAWFIKQSKNESKRRMLLSQFMLSDVQATTWYYDLEYTLKKISSYDPVNNTDVIFKLEGPYPSGCILFDTMSSRIKLKSMEDIPKMIVSNRDVAKKHILGLMDVVSTIILPFALIFPEVMVDDAIFMAQGLIQIGIAIDDFVQEKDVGGKRFFFGLLNAVPTVPGASRLSKSIYSKVNNFFSTKEKELLKFETEEAERLLQNNYNGEAIKDSNQISYSLEVEKDNEFNKPAKEFRKYLDLDSQASSIGKQIITMEGQQYLVDSVNNGLRGSLYSFEIENGNIKNVMNTGKTVYYNKNAELWDTLALKGGGKDSPPPTKIRKLKEQEDSSFIAELFGPSEIEPILPKGERPYKIINNRKELNYVVFDSYLNRYRYADARSTSNILGVTPERKLVELSAERPIIVPDESYINDLTASRENLFSFDKIEGTEDGDYITGIVFRKNKYTVLYKGEIRTVCFNSIRENWYLEGSTKQLEYSVDGEWVEVVEESPFPVKNNFLTHAKLNWDLQLLNSGGSIGEVPGILNFLLIEGVDESAIKVLGKFNKAATFSAPVTREKRLYLFVYGEIPFFQKIFKEKIEYFNVNVINLKNFDDIKEFFEEELKTYMEEGRQALVSDLMRLKLSKFYEGIFPTNNVHVPADIFYRSLAPDETGLLFQTPVFDEVSQKYVVPRDVIASKIRGGEEQPLVLESFLDNLKKVRSRGESIDDYAPIFTQSLEESIPKYREYLKYYSSIKGKGMKITGETYQKVAKYFEQLSSTGINKYENNVKLLEKDQIVFPFLSLDPAEKDLMIQNNVQIITTENKNYIVFPTGCNVRELFSFKKSENTITNVQSTGMKIYFGEGGVQILEKELGENFPYTHTLSATMVNIQSKEGGKLFSREYFVTINNIMRKVIYDIKLKSWRRYKCYSSFKMELGRPILLENGEWRERARNEFNLVVDEGKVTYFPIPSLLRVLPQSRELIKNKMHFFVQDVESMRNFLKTFRNLPPSSETLIVHYDIIDSLQKQLHDYIDNEGFRYMKVQCNNVRNDPLLRHFFENDELSQYYEAAREKFNYKASHDIMKYQIMYNNYGIFLDHDLEASQVILTKRIFAKNEDVLLRYPDKITTSESSTEFRVANNIFATHRKNEFFKTLSNKILENLKKDNGFFGSILKEEHTNNALFPYDDVLGSTVFHNTLMEVFPALKAVINYMNHDCYSVFYSEDFNKLRNYFFTLSFTK